VANRDQPDELVEAGQSLGGHKLETRILRGTAWIGLGVGARQLFTWVSMLVLVRLLEPESFGVVALAFTVVSSLQYLRGSGIWAALVYRRQGIEEAAASAFAYLLVSSVVVYGVCFATAPWFARIFGVGDLQNVLRVLALLIVFAGLGIVPGAILERELRYTANAYCDLCGAGVQLVVAIGLAVAGAGVWSLVGGQLANAMVETVLLWWLTPWRPSLRRASWTSLKELFRYGRFAGAANVAIFLGGTLDTVTVGRMLGATATGFYSVAFRMGTISESVFNVLIIRAMFPAFALVRGDAEALRRTFVQHAQRMALLIVPVTVFMVLAAQPIVLTLLGAEWSSIVTPLRILAVFGLVRALSATAGTVFRGTGRPKLAMWFAVANVVLLVPALILLTGALDLNGTAIALVVCMTVTTIPALAITIRLVGVSAGDLMRTLRPSLCCSGALALSLGILLPVTSGARPIVSLLVLLIGGIGVYLASAAFFARHIVVPMWVDLRGTRT
jgi:PST family polysaccharide transporter